MKISIVPRCRPDVIKQKIRQAELLAHEISSEWPELDWRRDGFSDHVIREEIGDEPTLYLDDFSEIPIIGVEDNSSILQQRARLRAGDGDWVAQTRMVEAGFSDYCEHLLELGRVNWLYPANEDSDPRKIALACWQDQGLRHDLEQAVRQSGLRYIHPHISTLHVWELADLLQKSTNRPISVIGPTPAISKWANDKIEFSRTVSRLLGESIVPHSESAYNFAMLTKIISRLAATHPQLAIKFPYGTGGYGNFLVDTKIIRGLNLKQTRSYLVDLLDRHCWPENGRVLVDVWETDVIKSPSVQIWIPPLNYGDPVIEGVFEQAFTGKKGQYVGARPADLPSDIQQQIVNDSYLLAYLYQNLGYVGRCSFDLILVGERLSDCRIEFIECNARWSGTSIPMTLMNRLAVPEQNRTFSVRKIGIPDVWQLEFAELIRAMDAELYRPRTGQGSFIFFNPARITEHSAVEAIAIADCIEKADRLLESHLPITLDSLVHPLGAESFQRPEHVSLDPSISIKPTVSTKKSLPDEPSSPSQFLMDHADFDEAGRE